MSHKGHNNNTIQVYSMNVMTHVIALEAGQSNQGTSEPITPAIGANLSHSSVLNIFCCVENL